MTVGEIDNDDNAEMKRDLKTLKDYIKDDLYFLVKFVYEPDTMLDVEGAIYKNYYENCKPRMGYGDAATTNRTAAARLHMQNVWNAALAKKVQVKALSQKRSAVYTVMQNKFHGP
jgi:hypothetical protein